MPLMVVVCILALTLPTRTQQSRTDSASATGCSPSVLPENVRTVLSTEFQGWHIQAEDSLDADGHAAWRYEKYFRPGQCPGIALGRFESPHTSVAVLLVDGAGQSYQLLEFTDQSSPRRHLLEQSAKAVLGAVFIRTARIADFFDARSMRQFQPVAADGIVIVEGSRRQFGASIFFWTRKGFKQEPIEY